MTVGLHTGAHAGYSTLTGIMDATLTWATSLASFLSFCWAITLQSHGRIAEPITLVLLR